MEFSVGLHKTEGSTLELSIIVHWLVKTLLNNSTLSLYLVMHLFWWSSSGMQGILLLLGNNDFNIDQYVLYVLVKAFIILFKIRE